MICDIILKEKIKKYKEEVIKMNNNLIKKSLDFLDHFAEKYSIHFDSENRYYTIIKHLKDYAKETNIVLDNDIREDLIAFLYSLNIPYLDKNISEILGIDNQDLMTTDLNQLSDNQLVGYFALVLSTITFAQNGDLLLMKYGVIIWQTGFHNLAKLCRGKVIDIKTREIISYPFDKFFNLNEVPETNETVIKNYINHSSYVWATEKKDGSTISANRMKNGKWLITTNGSFDNDQIKMANEILKNKYSQFLNHAEEGYTFIFELIHPENRIVLNYGEEKDLYLLSVRDLNSYKLLPLSDIHTFAKKYGFPVPDVYGFKDLDTMINLAHTLKNANKEGWVIRIGVDDKEYMVKLKLDEYFDMHHAFGKVKLGWVYKHLIAGDLDDFLSLCSDEQKKTVFSKLDIIAYVREKIKEKTISEANACLLKYQVSKEEFLNDKDKMIAVIGKVLSSNSNVKNFIVCYLKDEDKLETSIQRIFYKNMKPFFEEFGENVDE